MKLTPQQRLWLRGLELALAGAIYTAYENGAFSFPHNKAGWLKLGAVFLSIAVAVTRAYLQKSPLTQ